MKIGELEVLTDEKKENEEKVRNLLYSILAMFLGCLIVWPIWNALVPIYFVNILPEQFHHISYWHMIGLSILVRFFTTAIRIFK